MKYYSIKISEIYRGNEHLFTLITNAKDEKELEDKIKTKLIRWSGKSLSKVESVDPNSLWDIYYHEEDTMTVNLVGYINISEDEFKVLKNL